MSDEDNGTLSTEPVEEKVKEETKSVDNAVLLKILEVRRNSKHTVDSEICSQEDFLKLLEADVYKAVSSVPKIVTFSVGAINYRVKFK